MAKEVVNKPESFLNTELQKAKRRSQSKEKQQEAFQKELDQLLRENSIITIDEKRALAKKLFWHKCRIDPLYWLEHRFGEDPKAFMWTLFEEENNKFYQDHRWDGDINPLAKAWQGLAEWNPVAIESATGTGKTYFLARVVLWFLDCWKDSLVATFAPKLQQLETQLWKEIRKIFHKFKKIRPHSRIYRKLKLVVDEREYDENAEDGEGSLDGWMAIGYPTQVQSGEESATGAQGLHRKDMLLIAEETPGIKSAVITAMEETCTADHNLILAVGNPDSELDTLHTFASHPYVTDIRISGEDHPNVVSGKTLVPGAVTRKKLRERREKNGADSTIYLSRGRGIAPSQGKESLIRISWIKEALIYDTKGFTPDKKSVNALGMDVSDSEEGDKTSLAYGEKNLLTDLISFHCNDPIDLCYNLIYDESKLQIYEKREERSIRRFDIPTIHSRKIQPASVGIDTVGIGRTHYHTLAKKRIKVTPLEGGVLKKALKEEHFVSLRDQMWWALRNDLREGNIAIFIKNNSTRDALCKQLTAPKFWIQGKGIRVEPKSEVKKRLGLSPDLGDSVAYWNWMRRGYYKKSKIVTGTI